MTNIIIETSRLLIRPYRQEDAKDVAFYSQQPVMAHWMSDMVLRSELEALSWINWINSRLNMSEPFIILAIEHKTDKKCIGIVGVHPKEELDNEIEIIYGVSDEFQGRGYATEASGGLIKWIFNNIELYSLSGIVKPENFASGAVIRKLGFDFIESMTLPYDGAPCKFDYYVLESSPEGPER